MNKKRAVFLFGAGAVLDWGAPRTICNGENLSIIPEHGSTALKNRVCCLTHLISNIGFSDNDNSRITEKIRRRLKEDGKNNNNVNFETIINVIEDLYTYSAARNKKSLRNSFFSITDLDAQISDFFNFSYSEVNSINNKYSISIPEFPRYSGLVTEEISPLQKYYELFLNELLAGIIGHVSKYSYYTTGHNVIYNECNKPINNKFCDFMKTLEKDYFLRMYTLNYDRLFKILLRNEGIEIFEGFEVKEKAVEYDQRIPPNIPRIVSDFSSNIFYNLHGSAYWGIEELNVNDLPGYQYYLSAAPESNIRAATIQVEKGKLLLLTNIITGFQKVQRTAVSPFRQMLSAFDRDCIEAEKIFIIGYSFGDEHVNDIIRNSRKYNQNVEINIINPIFDDSVFKFDFLSHWGFPNAGIYSENEIYFPDFNVKVIKKKFGEYLKAFY